MTDTVLANALRAGSTSIGVVGLGYIGFSTAAYYGRKGLRVLGYDVDPEKVSKFNAGETYIENIQFWIGFDFKHLASSGLVRASTEATVLADCGVVFVCVPTERNGDPYMGILKQTVADLAKFTAPGTLVIVESTLTPGTAQSVVVDGFKAHGREDVLVAIAPRRDWFVDSGRNLTDIPRIVGGSTPHATDEAAAVLGLVCKTVIPASSHNEAELIKSVENAYRHMDITLANQLTFAYPNVNMREVLNLVGTKWNMNSYHPNFGVGGYCIAPASKYVQSGTDVAVPLLAEATRYTDALAGQYASLMSGYKRVTVLGVAYKGGLKVHVLSPGLELARELVAADPALEYVCVQDPMYTEAETLALFAAEKFPDASRPFPECLRDADLIVVTADHPEYVVPSASLAEWLKPGAVVLDAYGIWSDLNLSEKYGVEYIVLGEKNWKARLSK